MAVNRAILGIVALVMLGLYLVFTFWQPEWFTEAEAFRGGCVRIGLVLAALWLALPELERTPNWLAKGLIGLFAVVLVLWKPRLIPFAFAAVVAILTLSRIWKHVRK